MKDKKKAKNLKNLTDSNIINYKELQDLHEKLTYYLSKLKKDYFIPLHLFKTKLAPLETVVKFLIENCNISIKESSILLNRSPKTVWQAYKFSKEKYSKSFVVKKEQIFIPISIFSNRKLSILESLVSHLKETQNLKFSQIAVLLDRDQRTIWTLYSRYRKKYAK